MGRFNIHIGEVEKGATFKLISTCLPNGCGFQVLANGQSFGVVPKNVTLAKRLAQCLHHVLPFGVHLKAIETYKLIFNIIGPEGLSKDLFLYSFGLFPLFTNATITVKRSLIELYDAYFVPLKENLRPGLPGKFI